LSLQQGEKGYFFSYAFGLVDNYCICYDDLEGLLPIPLLKIKSFRIL